jgi:hypothetical protein
MTDPSEHANNLVSEYWAKQPKTELGVKKRGRQSTSAQPAARAAKAPRKADPTSTKAAVGNGMQRAPTENLEESEDDLGPDFVRTHVDSIDKYLDVKDWEKIVDEIDTIERGPDNQLLVFMTMYVASCCL